MLSWDLVGQLLLFSNTVTRITIYHSCIKNDSDVTHKLAIMNETHEKFVNRFSLDVFKLFENAYDCNS